MSNEEELYDIEAEISAIDLKLNEIMAKKAKLYEMKNKVKQRIKYIDNLNRSAQSKLHGYSYQFLYDLAGKFFTDTIIAYSMQDKSKYTLFLDMCIDVDYMIDNIGKDTDFINAVINTCGGKVLVEGIGLHYNDAGEYAYVNKGKSNVVVEPIILAVDANRGKRFAYKLYLPPIQKELLKYKYIGEVE